MPDFYKFSLSLPQGLYDAYERAAEAKGQPTLDLIRDVLHDNAISQDWDIGDQDFDIHLYRSLTIEVADAAEHLKDANGWNEDITLLAIREKQKDPIWLAGYKKLIGDDNVYALGNPIKSSVNQNFGQYVKVRLNAKNKVDENGKRMTRQVSGELVRTYTLLVPAN
jgi:hypothetical protein